MSESGFSFESGNLGKLFAIPKYALSMLFSLFVPRDRDRWAFGSGIGVGEGSLAVALQLKAQDDRARIAWIVSNDAEAEAAAAHGFVPVHRRGWAGFWETLRARNVVITHGLGDVNRFGITGARIVHLGHGSPLKKLHLDSPVTTTVGGPAPMRAVLNRMYLAGSRRVMMYVAGSAISAERLRTAYRVAPGRVRVLGDARDDVVAEQAKDQRLIAAARAEVRALLGLPGEDAAEPLSADGPLILYAPTWRDGSADPAVPSRAEGEQIRALMRRLGARLIVRSHPLGAGAYEAALGERVHSLGSESVRDITPLLGAFDAVITDYSSLAVDFSLYGRPIIWFAPDLEEYAATRGLYEPLEVTAAGKVERNWPSVLSRLERVLDGDGAHGASARADARALAARFHRFPEGGAAARVLAEIRRLERPASERIGPGAVFFESFYGRQVSCNPLALDREIATRHPEISRFWSVVDEGIAVPPGATPVLVGGPDWFAARRYARLLVVNDWLRFGFRGHRGQTVLQTWHGTMLKHLALGRPGVSLRTRMAIHRESRRWDLLLSQNPHSTAQFRSSYAFRGEIIETGYPRDDRLARAVAAPAVGSEGSTANRMAPALSTATPEPGVTPGPAGERARVLPERIPPAVEAAKRALGLPSRVRVLAYTPTWREPVRDATGDSDRRPADLDLPWLAEELGEEWAIVIRGHTRSARLSAASAIGSDAAEDRSTARATGGGPAPIVDASRHPDVNDVILAADLLVTDYSSVMFDAAVACTPLAFFVPDLADYRDRERGFTFDFAAEAPGPLLTTREEVLAVARAGVEMGEAYASWRERYAPHDDGYAARRVVDELERRGLLHS